MPEQIFIGNFAKGLKLNRYPPDIDNDAFATLFNFYVWRGRVKKKRGTDTLDRLNVQVQMVAATPLNWQYLGPNLIGGAINLVSSLGLEANSSYVPGSISLTVGANTYTEPATPDGTLVGAPGGSGTINYASGAITISGGGASQITGTFSYYPDLPVMGCEDLVSNTFNNKYPLSLVFDTKRAYQVNQNNGNRFYNVSFYKGTNTPVLWSAPDDSQFWSCNYQSAFWATNNKPGLHILNGTYTAGSGTALITFNFKTLAGANYTSLIVGDVVWFNEWNAGGVTINAINGTVSNAADAINGNYIVTFTGNQTVAATGILILLTNSVSGQDGIRWYDGDPTNRTGLPTGSSFGWVNFSPPLTATTTSINDMNLGKYYLVGALAIIPFKDRLLFFGPQIATSNGIVFQRPIQDTVIFSWNGTPYYNALVPTSSTTTETFDPTAYYVDQAGKGGYQSAGISQPAISFVPNGDVYLVGFGGTGKKTRLVYTNNDIQPFLFYLINSEKPSSATFSAITMDEGGLDIGQYGLCFTTQQSSDRVDIDIPDTIFQIQSSNNGVQRVNSVRDFYQELIFFTYPTGNGQAAQGSWKYPNTTLLYNYVDMTWALFRENWTAQGTYREGSNLTWLTLPFKTWNEWRQPWNAGSTIAQFPSIICGNPQGYVLKRTNDTGEAPSGDIQAIADNGVGQTRITSVNHCVNIGDYLYFSGGIGSTYLNGKIGKVIKTSGANLFDVDIQFQSFTYLGLGKYTRLCQPLLQTRQFPVYWQEGRKVRIGVQKYLFDTTQTGEVTLNIYLSQDSDSIFNQGPIIPLPDVTNSSLIYSQTLYTCPELTNLGLMAPNINLQMTTAETQSQTWHRVNTSLIGDTFQLGITLSDAQMRSLTPVTAEQPVAQPLNSTDEIILHGIQLTVDRGPILS